jgi:hypothetical protein
VKYLIYGAATFVILLIGYEIGYQTGKRYEGDIRERNGQIRAKTDIAQKLSQYFGKIKPEEYKDAKHIYDIKSTGIYAVEERGVMTIKIAE